MTKTPKVEISKDSAAWGQLRDLSDRTGAVHNAQANQLRLWPLVAFTPKPRTCEISIDPETRVVTFRPVWKENLSMGPKAIQARKKAAETLATWCSNLLGDKWSIRVQGRAGRKLVLKMCVDGIDAVTEVTGATITDDPLRFSWRTRFRPPAPKTSSSSPSPS